jgi:hypothetical protein
VDRRTPKESPRVPKRKKTYTAIEVARVIEWTYDKEEITYVTRRHEKLLRVYKKKATLAES